VTWLLSIAELFTTALELTHLLLPCMTFAALLALLHRKAAFP
jgi:hypothetical protein